MNFYFAPMDGLTGYLYRNAHHEFFRGVDRYYSPFLSANQSKSFKTKEIIDILPEHNEGIVLIPQILSNHAKDFIHTANKIATLGYNEVNLNLGCPSLTVVSKGRGSGFLAKRDELDLFLDEIFSRTVPKISIKTRIGKDSKEEFYALMEIFNKYPIEELTIHPRLQKEYYQNTPDLKMFEDGMKLSKNKVCYNGDIFSAEAYQSFSKKFSGVQAVMLGRGLVANPQLADEIKNGAGPDKYLLKEFHDKLYADYKNEVRDDRNVLYRMKEIWSYMSGRFSANEIYAKRIRESECLSDYEETVAGLFREQDIILYKKNI